MIGIYFFVLSVVSFADTSCACNSPRFNMSVIFLILMLPSTSAKISFSNSQLISEVIFLLTVKISNALCWSKSRHTKSFFTSITRGIKPCIIRKLFLQEFSFRNYPPSPLPLAMRVQSRISHDDESTCSQTSNYFFCIFSGKTFFLFIELRILIATNLMENFKSEKLSCKISVSGRLGRSIHMRKGNDPKRKKIKTFSA